MARLTWLLALVAVSALFAWSAASCTASLLAIRADRLAELADAGSGAGAAAIGARLLTSMEIARRLDPLNANHLHRLAAEHERQAMRMPVYARGRREPLLEALALNRLAAGLRPTWPMGYTPILRLKLKLSELDQEFSDVFGRAVQLGRWEPAAVRGLAEIGIAAWPLLDGETRAEVLGVLERGLRTQPRFVIEHAIRTGNGRLVEPLIAGDPALETLYERIAGPKRRRTEAPDP